MKPIFNNHKLIFQLLRQLFVKIVVLCLTGMLNFIQVDLPFIGSHLVKRITHHQNDNLHIIILIIWLIIKRTRSVTLILIMRHSLLTYMELKFKLQLLKFKSSVQKFVNICKYKQSLSLNFAAYSAFNCQAGPPCDPKWPTSYLTTLSNNLIYCTEWTDLTTRGRLLPRMIRTNLKSNLLCPFFSFWAFYWTHWHEIWPSFDLFIVTFDSCASLFYSLKFLVLHTSGLLPNKIQNELIQRIFFAIFIESLFN